MSVYTRRFGKAVHGSAGEATELFVHPGTGTYIARDLIVVNTGSAVLFAVVELHDASGIAGYLLFDANVPIASTRHYDLRQEIVAGESVWFTTSGSVGQALLTGYQFQT